MRTVSVVAAALLTTSCGTLGPDVDAAEGVAAAFEKALSQQNATAACSLLAPETRHQVESDGSSCQQSLLDQGLPSAGPTQQATAYGRAAQVVLRGDVLFLGRFGDRWLVTAAGCRPRQDRPYDCTVSGG